MSNKELDQYTAEIVQHYNGEAWPDLFSYHRAHIVQLMRNIAAGKLEEDEREFIKAFMGAVIPHLEGKAKEGRADKVFSAMGLKGLRASELDYLEDPADRIIRDYAMAGGKVNHWQVAKAKVAARHEPKPGVVTRSKPRNNKGEKSDSVTAKVRKEYKRLNYHAKKR